MADPRGKGGKRKRQCSYVPLCFGGSSFLLVFLSVVTLLEIVRNHLFFKMSKLCQLACMKLGDFVILDKIYPFDSRGAGLIDAKACFLSFRLETGRKNVFSLIYILVVELTAIPSEKPKKEQ
jgi:hypothetical protein